MLLFHVSRQSVELEVTPLAIYADMDSVLFDSAAASRIEGYFSLLLGKL